MFQIVKNGYSIWQLIDNKMNKTCKISTIKNVGTFLILASTHITPSIMEWILSQKWPITLLSIN